jgi:riboflavin biosynthesis pyrimidine reductase
MKPHVICHMMVSLDGRIHPSRWTASPDGNRQDWTTIYEGVHATLAGDAWLVGRVTMAEMSKGTPHPPSSAGKVARPHHFAKRDAATYAIAFDRSRKLHFAKADIGGDHVVVLLGPGVPDAHLAELAGDGISYVVAPDEEMAPRPLFELLGRELGIKRLLVEGGGNVNGSLLAAGVVDELSLLIAPAIDGALGITGVFEVPDAKGLAGKVQLRFVSSEALAHGVVHLRYAVEAGQGRDSAP